MKVAKLLLPSFKVIKHKPSLEGNYFKNGIMHLGDRAGLEVHIGNFFHELAHLVEIEDNRCHLDGWGLVEKEAPITANSIKREARVWGIQAILCEAAGIEFGIMEHAKLFRFFEARYHVPGYTYCDSEANKVVANWILKSKQNWSLSAILAELKRKDNILCDIKT